jgi:hypothetical protein
MPSQPTLHPRRRSSWPDAPPFPTGTLVNRLQTPAVFVLVLALAGCAALGLHGEDAQPIVDKRLIGMPVGDSFQRYGKPTSRAESSDGSLAFDWSSGIAKVAAGPVGPEESVCRLRLSASRAGRIVAAPIVRDGRGQRQLSLCAELFEPA